MLDFRKYFKLNSNGDLFHAMMDSIITKNGNGLNISKDELELRETSDFKSFKSLVEQHIKLYIFTNVNEVLGEWKRKNFLKINALEKGVAKKTLQNYANDEFKAYYRSYKRASEYFANDYNTLTTSEIYEELKQMENIYKSLERDDAFSDNDILLYLLLDEFQECTRNNDLNDMVRNFKDELTNDQKEWDLLEDDEIETVTTNNKIKLYDKWNQKKVAMSKLKPWDIAKRKQIKQEIENIKKELKDIEVLEKIENLNPTVISRIVREVNDSQMTSQSATSGDDMDNYLAEHAANQKQTPTL